MLLFYTFVEVYTKFGKGSEGGKALSSRGFLLFSYALHNFHECFYSLWVNGCFCNPVFLEPASHNCAIRNRQLRRACISRHPCADEKREITEGIMKLTDFLCARINSRPGAGYDDRVAAIFPNTQVFFYDSTSSGVPK